MRVHVGFDVADSWCDQWLNSDVWFEVLILGSVSLWISDIVTFTGDKIQKLVSTCVLTFDFNS